MPRKQPEMANATAVTGPRLPNFGAEMAVGPPSRAYRSPLSFGATSAAAIAPSYRDDEADIDAGADDASDVDSDDGDDSDADVGDGADDDSDDLRSET